MLPRKVLTAVFVLPLLASLAFSQQPRGPGRGGFGPGQFGPPGMMGGGNLMLLGMSEVREELGIKDNQQKSIDDLLADVQEQMRDRFGRFNFQELQDLSPEDREKRFAEMRKEAENDARKQDEKLTKILDAKQSARLNQLRLQREGAGALNRPDIAEKLKLTKEQQEKIAKALEQGFGFIPPEERQKLQEETVAVLSKAQQAQFAELKGKEFAFPEQGFGPGGFGGGPGGRGPGGFGGPGGPGGFGGGPMGQTRKLVAQFDKDGDGRLNTEERKAARESIKNDRGNRGGFGGPGGPGGRGPGNRGPEGRGPEGRGPEGRNPEARGQEGRPAEGQGRVPEGRAGEGRGPGERGPEGRGPEGRRGQGGPGGGFGPPGGFGRREEEPVKPGPKVSPEDVKPIADAALYDPKVIRTLFLEFENSDWEEEMADFNNTDVEVPATLLVDGKKFPDVGVHFRGMSSFMGVGPGHKRSLNLSLDFVDEKQRLYGYKTLNLLNSHEDPTFLHTVLYSHVARQYIPAPKANFVKVVINGESWGLYVSAQQFNKEFLADNFKSSKGTRWKVPGSPGGRGGLEYLGDNVEAYKRIYEMKTSDGEKAWKALMELCRTLNQTPADKLEEALKPMLDVDGALWFLALENALINSDGYWIRASDYSIFLDEKGKFHIMPHDANETFQPAMGPGMGGFGGGPGGRGGPGAGPGADPVAGQGGRPGPGPGGFGGRSGGGVEIDPLVGLNDTSKPLRSKLLAVPALRAKYLEHVRTIAEEWLDWKKLGPIVKQYETLIEKEVQADTRKLTSFAAFQRSVGDEPTEAAPGDRRPGLSLRSFAEQRRKFLLSHPEISKLAANTSSQK